MFTGQHLKKKLFSDVTLLAMLACLCCLDTDELCIVLIHGYSSGFEKRTGTVLTLKYLGLKLCCRVIYT